MKASNWCSRSSRLPVQVLLAERAGRVLGAIRESAAAGFDEAPRRLPHLPPGFAAGPGLGLVGERLGGELIDGCGGPGEADAQLGDLRQRLVVEAIPRVLRARPRAARRRSPVSRLALEHHALVGGDRRLGLFQLAQLLQLRLARAREFAHFLRRRRSPPRPAPAAPPAPVSSASGSSGSASRRAEICWASSSASWSCASASFFQQAQRPRRVLDRVLLGDAELGAGWRRRRSSSERMPAASWPRSTSSTRSSPLTASDELGRLGSVRLAGIEDVVEHLARFGGAADPSAEAAVAALSRPVLAEDDVEARLEAQSLVFGETVDVAQVADLPQFDRAVLGFVGRQVRELQRRQQGRPGRRTAPRGPPPAPPSSSGPSQSLRIRPRCQSGSSCDQSKIRFCRKTSRSGIGSVSQST